MTLPPGLSARLMRLAPDQRAAATAPPGPILCVAPAGSGKTTTLVARVAWRVATGTDPRSVTCLTFNRSACEELDGRLGGALTEAGLDGDGGDPSDERRAAPIRVRTFHALGREILSEAGVDVTRLVDRSSVIAELAAQPLSSAALRALDDGFSRLKLDRDGEDPTPRGHPIEGWIRAAFERYEQRLWARGELDFDDLVARALDLLETDGAMRARWTERCRTLFVDEVQDLDRSQLRMALLLAGEQRDVFLVGDDDQTIYAWRLADVRRVLDLAARLPDLRRIDLVTNHRCPPAVVERAVRLIEHNRERFGKRIRATDGSRGSLVLAPDPGDPLARARRLLERWFDPRGGIHAVLARTNRELAPFAAVAVELGIPYRAEEDGLLIDGPEVDAVLALLESAGGSGPGAAAILTSVAAGRTDRAGVARAMLDWLPAHGRPDAFVRAVRRARERRVALRQEDAPLVLATAHATKGLEFDRVACVGLDERVFPSTRSLADAPEPARALEEERRLAYVAWTRARRSLHLVYDPYAPSPFLREAFEATELAA